ncbi:putative transcriptional regulatory protein pdtaR [Rubripirellula tenax]|uniref:Putative transcriptional regulatory protein pdtaR n=2 Tax=Rubripirellula tenax TaxID=2528015 RepID=A0A5C6FFQ2_9BACT|nr:putative transcriptional regulatory protein pdtaR [Rubripirellula tenax]
MKSTSSLKLMLVDQSTPRRDILEKILRDSGYVNVFATSGLSDVFSLVDRIAPDVVLIELDSPNRDTLEQLRAIREQRPTPVLMFAHDQDAQTVHAAVDSGVCAYMVDSVDLNTVKPAIALAMATFNAYRRVRAEADAYRKELGTQKRLDRAKSLLMEKHSLSESEAYRTMRKMAMDENKKLNVIAEGIILGHYC